MGVYCLVFSSVFSVDGTSSSMSLFQVEMYIFIKFRNLLYLRPSLENWKPFLLSTDRLLGCERPMGQNHCSRGRDILLLVRLHSHHFFAPHNAACFLPDGSYLLSSCVFQILYFLVAQAFTETLITNLRKTQWLPQDFLPSQTEC